MNAWKDALCLLAIFMAYGLAGHLDYQDAVAMEEAMRDAPPPPCIAPPCATPDAAAQPQINGSPARRDVAAVCSLSVCQADDQ